MFWLLEWAWNGLRWLEPSFSADCEYRIVPPLGAAFAIPRGLTVFWLERHLMFAVLLV